MNYLIVIEKTSTGYSAYSPDVPGCVATGSTREEIEKEMKEALEFHLQGLKGEGLDIPLPHSYSATLSIAA